MTVSARDSCAADNRGSRPTQPTALHGCLPGVRLRSGTRASMYRDSIVQDNRTCAWRIDTEAGNGQIRETRCDEELQLRMICSPSLCPR